MSKVKIKTLLKAENKVTENYFDAIQAKNKIIYHDGNCQVVICFSSSTIIRENDEFRLELPFVKGKTTQCPYLLKAGNGHLSLEMYTYSCTYIDNKFKVIYQIVGGHKIQFELELIS